MFIVILLCSILGLILYIHGTQRRKLRAMSNIKGPFCVPGIGSVQYFFSVNPKNLIKTLHYAFDRYGKVSRFTAFHRVVVLSADVELNEQLLASQKHIVKQSIYRVLRQWLGVGIFLSDGKKWLARRKMLAPTFHFKMMEQFVRIADQQSTILCTSLLAKADGRTAFDVHEFVCLAAMDIIAEFVMGRKINAQKKENNEYVDAINELTALMAWRLLRVDLNYELIFSILYPHLKLRQMKLIKKVKGFTQNVIKERRQELATQKDEEESSRNVAPTVDTNDDGCKPHLAILDVLLLAEIDGKPLIDEDIREEMDQFLYAGHDTSSAGISFVLHLLSRNDGVQKKLYDEVCTVLGDANTNRAISIRDLNQLKYTECVIKESLRLYPPAPIIGREIVEDFHYTHSKLGKGVIPAGSEFLVFLHGMLRDEKHFTDPLEFKPERHEWDKGLGSLSFLPFSAGPRVCIGQKFAMLELKLVVAKLVHQFELLPLGSAVDPVLNIILHSSNGFQLGLKRRVD